MDIRTLIGVASGVVAFSSYFFYIPSILKGKTKPNRASWWIWGLVGFLIVASYYVSGARGTIWVPLSEAVGPFLIAILAIWYGEGGWTRFDKLCLVGAAFGTLLWWLTKTAEVGLIFYLFIDFTAVLPTIRKSFHRPENEDRNAWMLTFSGQVLNLFAVERFVFSILLYPIYMIITNGIIFALQFRKKGATAFSTIDLVSQCLSDKIRTGHFEKAISKQINKGGSVLEVGAGSGILSLFAARAGARKVVALEFDPFIAKAAERVVKANNFDSVIDIRIGDGCTYEFEPDLKFDVAIVEMLTVGMIDEHQVEAVNNLHRRGAVHHRTVFIPFKQETFVTLGRFDFNAYGFYVPFMRHLWKFHHEDMKKFDPITQKTLLNSIDFSSAIKEEFEATIPIRIAEDGIMNCVYLSSVSHLTDDIALGDTDAFNGPVAIPVDERHVRRGQEMLVSVGYTFGKGYESIKIRINE